MSLPAEEDARFLDKVERLTLTYFFYYREDFGLGGHLHDLEAVDFVLDLESSGECRRVEVRSVTAFAHGNQWYSNLLEVEEGTKFPLVLFVEEGKHACAPDRNVDGYFTRGYDVNHRVNDAWGVRDVMGSGVLLSATYRSEMTKPRRPADQLLPPETPLLCVPPERISIEPSHSPVRYELREATRVPECLGPGGEEARLVSFMRYHRFGAHYETLQSESAAANELKSLRSAEPFVSASLRVDGAAGAALVFRGFDLRQAWLVPKINVSASAASFGALYTPSASRFFDYYLAAGARRQFRSVEVEREIVTLRGAETFTFVEAPRWDFYGESGIRIRAQIPPKARPFALGYSFAGLRLGVQALGLGRLEDIRLTLELGAGVW